MECYSAFKRKELLIPAITGMDFEDIMLNEISQSEDDKCYIIHFGKIPRIVKIKDMESQMKIARCQQTYFRVRRKWGGYFLRSIVSVLHEEEFLDFVKQ